MILIVKTHLMKFYEESAF